MSKIKLYNTQDVEKYGEKSSIRIIYGSITIIYENEKFALEPNDRHEFVKEIFDYIYKTKKCSEYDLVLYLEKELNKDIQRSPLSLHLVSTIKFLERCNILSRVEPVDKTGSGLFNDGVNYRKKIKIYLNENLFNYLSKLHGKEFFTDIEEVIKQKEAMLKIDDIDFDVDAIKKDRNKLIKYLEHIAFIETDIYSLKNRYKSLLSKNNSLIFEGSKEYQKLENVFIRKELALKEEIIKIEDKISNKPNLKNKIIVDKPKKPVEPTFDMSIPEEPTYVKPGLFNKKKVLLENEILKENFERQMKLYKKKYAEFSQKFKEYKEEIKIYEDKLVECKKQEELLNKTAYENELKEFKKSKEKWILELKEVNDRFEKFNLKKEKDKEEALGLLPNNSNIRKKLYELEYIDFLIKQDIQIRNKLYSYGVIYGKYRDFVSITTFIDYLKSGRCDSLEGSNGAYNIYEQETRTDIIIGKLDTIIDKLDEIKTTQYFIYNEIKEVKKSLEEINDQLLINNNLNTVQVEQLNGVINNTKDIAYNTKVTSYYSKKNARLTSALCFMELFDI